MKDYEIQVLDQYDMNVNSTRKTRGAVLCETSEGLLLLQKLGTSAKRIPILERIHTHLQENGYERIDAFVKNKNMETISEAEDGEKYVLKHWFGGRECDTRREEEILIGVRNLAMLHRILQNVDFTLGIEDAPVLEQEDLKSQYQRHNREMKKVRAFIRKQVCKGEFELLFLKSFDQMYDVAQGVTARLESSAYDSLSQRSREKHTYIHGDYNYHNLLLCGRDVATTNFEHFRQSMQIQDLYYFMRKVMEKNHWNARIGFRMLGEYQKVLPLEKAEQEQLAICLAYPEKFWKSANSYYRSSKVWMPMKTAEKLEMAIHQVEEKKQFLEQIFAFHL